VRATSDVQVFLVEIRLVHEDEVREGSDVLEANACELREPREVFVSTEERVPDVDVNTNLGA
jgi:hypothetical protein